MNWNELIKIFDIVSAISLIVCLNLVARYRVAWLFYSFATIFFVIVTAYRGLPGLTVMGLILIVTGLRNYWVQKKKKNNKKKKLNKKELKKILDAVNTTLAEYSICPSCMKKVFSSDDDCSIHTCYDSGFQSKLEERIKKSNI